MKPKITNIKEKKPKTRQSYKNVLKNNFFIIRYIAKIAPAYIPLTLMCGVISQVLLFIEHSYGIMLITDAIQYKKDFSVVLNYIIIIGVTIFAWHLFSGFYHNYWWRSIAERMEKKIKSDVYKRAKDMDLECYDNPDFYNNYIWNLNNIVPQMQKVVGNFQMVLDGLTNLALAGFMFITFDKIGLIFASIATLASFLLAFKEKKIAFNIEKERTPHVRKKNYIKRLFYMNDYAKDMRIYDIKEKFQSQYDEASGGIIKVVKKHSKKQIALSILSDFVFNRLVTLLYLVYLIYMAITYKKLSYGAIFALYRAVGRQFDKGVTLFVRSIPEFAASSMYIDKFHTFQNTQNKIVDNGTLELKKEPCEIKLTDVSFSYDGKTSVDVPDKGFVLKNINMTIRPREKVAIVGFNGAGKTTLTKLLMRLYEPTSGKIEIDGHDIKEYKLSSLRQNFGILFQDFQILAASIKENVAMDNKFDEQKIINALERSGLKEKLDTFSDGIDTIITKEFDENGVYLSGGENQKLAMARLLYKDSAYAILDEPSSALDPKAEYNVNKIMLDESTEKTVIFISHRMSTAQIADTVYFFENGQLIEQGTHETLMKQKGKYSELYELQAQKYKLAI